MKELDEKIKKLENELKSLQNIGKRGTLTFNLDDPYEKDDFMAALEGPFLKSKIDDLYYAVFRTHIKYNTPIVGEELTERDIQIIEAIWSKVNAHFNS